MGCLFSNFNLLSMCAVCEIIKDIVVYTFYELFIGVWGYFEAFKCFDALVMYGHMDSCCDGDAFNCLV